MDHYSTLGVAKTATPDEIKKAFRKLASQHHPDKGGDTKKFQEIQAAYDTLGDPVKKEQYDNPRPQFGQNPGGFYGQGVPPGFEDAFNQMFGGGGPFGDIFGRRQQQPQRNRNLSLQTQITLEDAHAGKNLTVSVTLPSGREQICEIKIPRGIQDGTTLRLAGMGDDSMPNMPRGDIHLTVHVQPHPGFQRQGDDLVCKLQVGAIDAIVGKTYNIDTIDKRTLEITIKPGTQPGTVMAAHGYGMPSINDNRFIGRMLIQIEVIIPTNLTEDQLSKLREINT
jgi:DnaJ-class molecular chaperone